jgi:hypothetical protein
MRQRSEELSLEYLKFPGNYRLTDLPSSLP